MHSAQNLNFCVVLKKQVITSTKKKKKLLKFGTNNIVYVSTFD